MRDDSNIPLRMRPYCLIDGALYQMLARAFPKWRKANGSLDVGRIAYTLNVTRECVYKWLRSDKIPPARAIQLIALSGRRLSEADLSPFVFKA